MAKQSAKSQMIVTHCTIKQLSEEQQIEAANKAIKINIRNAPQIHSLRRMMPGITGNPLVAPRDNEKW